eukprot:scaffold3058_cov165-Ochromonas_danica.AAC.27
MMWFWVLIAVFHLFGSSNAWIDTGAGTLYHGNRFLFMAKGKGITSGGGNQRNNDGTGASNLDAPRVRSDINVPVRQQIAWAKANKRLMSASSSSHIPKKFRQETRKEKKAKEEYIEVDYQNVRPPFVFVDGYNVIGQMEYKDQEGKMDLEEARDRLINDLAVVRGATGWIIEVVFDAYKVKSSGNSMFADGVIITYTSATETADGYIERRFEELRNEGFTNMIVATDDNMVRMSAGVAGCDYLPVSMLLEEIRIAYKGWEKWEEEMRQEAEKHNTFSIGDLLTDDLRAQIEAEFSQNKSKA